jgi:cyclophilin family peptidyl-prolyl cis-trans isomerase
VRSFSFLVLATVVAVIGMGAGCTNSSTSRTTTLQDSSTSTPVQNTTWSFPGILPAEKIQNKQIRLTTNKGDIVFKLYSDTAPNTVSNFVYLAEGGYYDGIIFHRVIENFMIQGGDPTGTGTGGPGYKFADELADEHTYTRGTVAMANAGKNTNGSQFFIMHQDNPLPHNYSIFGEVTEGMEVVDAIAATATNAADRPLEEIVMTKVTVEDVK